MPKIIERAIALGNPDTGRFDFTWWVRDTVTGLRTALKRENVALDSEEDQDQVNALCAEYPDLDFCPE